MGEAKRRKDLGIPIREKSKDFPMIDKKSLQKKVRTTLYKYPIIPLLFYSAAILTLIGGIFYVIRYYKLI